jgi:hypothetical protein
MPVAAGRGVSGARRQTNAIKLEIPSISRIINASGDWLRREQGEAAAKTAIHRPVHHSDEENIWFPSYYGR